MKIVNERKKRIESFVNFYSHSKQIFEELAKSDPSNERLGSLFSLCITPGGRFGGHNTKEIEVFYGNRPIGQITQIDQNLQSTTKLETAHGATLAYYRTDDGHVICNLYPAKSENQHPPEQSILLDYITDPEVLQEKAKKHWKMFIAYMECTCIDGSPSICHKLRSFYLRNFKRYVVDDTEQQSRSLKVTKEVLKFTLTVGLSGFLILLFTLAKENIEESKKQYSTQKTNRFLENISISSEETKRLLQENRGILKTIGSSKLVQKTQLDNIEKSAQEANRTLTKVLISLEKIQATVEKKPVSMRPITQKSE